MERRQEGARDHTRDRRFIERFSDPRIATNFHQVKIWVWILMWLFFAAGLFEFVHGLVVGPEALGPAFLATLIFWTFTAFFYRYLLGIQQYLENESVSNLNTMVERLNTLLLAFSFFGAFFYIATLVYRF